MVAVICNKGSEWKGGWAGIGEVNGAGVSNSTRHFIPGRGEGRRAFWIGEKLGTIDLRGEHKKEKPRRV